MKSLLKLSAAVIAVVAFAAPASAALVTFAFNTPTGDLLSSTHVYTAGTPVLSITATGYSAPGTLVDLYGKNDGSGEQGVGLMSDPSGQHEITGTGFVQLDDSALVGKVLSMTAGFAFNSATGPEAWAVYGSNTAGVLGTLLASGTDEALHTFTGISSYRYFDFKATNGNVLLNSVAVTPVTPIAAPEPLSLTLIGSGMLALGAMVRRRNN